MSSVAERLGSDTGGTFTDMVDAQGRVAKVLSTPDDPGAAVRRGIVALTHGAPEVLAHGTTIATNALLERRGAAAALITTAGFADVIEIARQDRPSLYDTYADRPVPLVPREWRYEVSERMGPDGSVIRELDLASIVELDAAVESVAVCLLHSDLVRAHEEQVAEALRGRGLDVSASHEISPEFREYERTVTTVINAYLRPVCRSYLRGLADTADLVLVMTSAGGLVPAAEAADRPASLLLSGPAGGVQAAAAVAVANGYPDALTFDMGGTSTDVCLVRDGHPEPAAERSVGGLPVRLPSLDVHTVGAGGGSIARVDSGGALTVGPVSAGADPGPACYGRGGTEPTVTDANLIAGRIPRDGVFPDLGRLDHEAAVAALDRAGVTADGVLTVVNVNMEQALRAVSVERGVDPRGLALVAFGGAGPLHACELAEALGVATVIVPARAGVLSAVGLLCSPHRRELVRSWPSPADRRGLEAARSQLADEAVRLVGRGDGATVETSVDCRYEGQSHELRVRDVSDFHAEHERRNGYQRPDAPVEVVALRARAEVASDLDVVALPDVARPTGVGPTVLAEEDCTIWVPEGWRARLGEASALIVERDR